MNMKPIAIATIVSSLLLFGFCQSEESNVRSAPAEAAPCAALANCLECNAEETQCTACAEGFAWNGSSCVEASSEVLCAGDPSRVLTFTDANGVLHYHCVAK